MRNDRRDNTGTDTILEAILDDGTYYTPGDYFFESEFNRATACRPTYGDPNGFCFGDSYDEIIDYLLTADFVSAFQLASLCLHHINKGDDKDLFLIFDEVCAADCGIDIQEMAEYFGLTEDEVAGIEARQRELAKEKEREVTQKGANGQ